MVRSESWTNVRLNVNCTGQHQKCLENVNCMIVIISASVHEITVICIRGKFFSAFRGRAIDQDFCI